MLTPGGTVLSLVDSSGGNTRLEVQDMVQEDSAGFKDQHIHVHIHPLQPGAPNVSAMGGPCAPFGCTV